MKNKKKYYKAFMLLGMNQSQMQYIIKEFLDVQGDFIDDGAVDDTYKFGGNTISSLQDKIDAGKQYVKEVF